jgi:hypothetical protein
MNQTDLPVWLLDVDGVINAFRRQPQGSWPRRSWTRVRVAGFEINAALPVIAFLREVHRRGLAEIRWHTTWQELSLDLGDALGLPTFHVQEAPEFAGRDTEETWWKLPAARRVLADEGRPVVWTDDDAAYLAPGDRKQLALIGPRLLIVAPDDRTGLNQADLDQIHLFLTDLKEGNLR